MYDVDGIKRGNPKKGYCNAHGPSLQHLRCAGGTLVLGRMPFHYKSLHQHPPRGGQSQTTRSGHTYGGRRPHQVSRRRRNRAGGDERRDPTNIERLLRMGSQKLARVEPIKIRSTESETRRIDPRQSRETQWSRLGIHRRG